MPSRCARHRSSRSRVPAWLGATKTTRTTGGSCALKNRSISPTRPAPCSTRTFSSRSSPSSRRAGAASRTPTISARSSSATRCLSRSPRRSPSRHDRSRRHAQSTRSGGGFGTAVLPPLRRVNGGRRETRVSYNKTDLL
uniref:(northern house mosquito) hypothetical protein n=1 Tax=Culex pipiens TaxID=7175 RepID=A0A8D8CYG8_CULPI